MSGPTWVETTVPPGYAVEEARGASIDLDLDDADGWIVHDGAWAFHARDIGEACRSAWRHWTAAVLRVQDVAWRYMPDGCEDVEVGGCTLTRTRRGAFQVFYDDPDHGFCAFKGTDDVDEAAARFAALVLFEAGMWPAR